MLRSHLVLALAASALVLGCGDSGSDGGGGSASTGSGGIEPPARPADAPAGDGAGTPFATSKLYLGTKTRAGANDPNAWKSFGYDLDGQSTSTDFANHCDPAGGAAPNNVFPDGDDGIDNAFGKVLLPVIKTAAAAGGVSDIEAELNGGIAEGTFAIILDLTDLGTAADYNPINARLYAGKNGAANTWEIVPELLGDGATLESALVKFPNSYLTGNTWVSGDKGTVTLALDIAGFQLNLNIRSAVITMDIDAGRTSGTNGVIAGVLDTEELLTELKKVIGGLDTSLCGSAGDNLLNQVRQASDILKDGTQTAGQECDGISIGLGFDATKITLGPVAAPAEPGGGDPCAEGAGGGAQ